MSDTVNAKDEREALAAQFSIRRIDVTAGLRIEMTWPQEVLATIAGAAADMLDEASAENYVEMAFGHPKYLGEVLTLTIQRHRGLTPHQLRQFAERERDDALARLAELRSVQAAPPEAADGVAERHR